MNVMMVSPFAFVTPHFETDLEIVQKHLDRADNVVMLGCNADLMICDINPTNNIARCLQCINKRKVGVKLLSRNISIESILLLTEQDRLEISQFNPDLKDIETIRGLQIDNFDIGQAALSSVISQTKDPTPDMEIYGEYVRYYMVTSLAVYRSVLNHLSRRNIDRVYAFNGRYASLRAVLRACQKAKTTINITERGGQLDHYAIWENTMPLDKDHRLKRMNEAWDDAMESNSREETASKFFIDRANNIVPNWFSHSIGQKKGLLPVDWDPSMNNICIFITSEHEIAAIGDSWKNPIYRDQMEGIRKIIESTRNNKSIQLYLRVHPNLKGVHTGQTAQLYALSAPNLKIIKPESEISSYALIKYSSKVVTFGSTVGIEAVYWETPSILVGQSIYRDLGGTYQPRNHPELIEMLNTKLIPVEKGPALVYGYFQGTYGIQFKYYESHGIFQGAFKGVVIKTNLLLRGLRVITLVISPLDRLFSFLNRQRLKYKYTY